MTEMETLREKNAELLETINWQRCVINNRKDVSVRAFAAEMGCNAVHLCEQARRGKAPYMFQFHAKWYINRAAYQIWRGKRLGKRKVGKG